ncbi:helix-turn-helix domain-containing protein [Rhizobium wuzhouense]|nr:helix-turn-helix transcriptional regulator [Rhizobium wuzhouense]
MFTGKQIAAARALLGMGQGELAAQAGVPVSTVETLESVSGELEDGRSEVDALRAVLEERGITFIDERVTSAAGGVGVRLSAAASTSPDTDARETIQYPEMAKDGPFGAGG